MRDSRTPHQGLVQADRVQSIFHPAALTTSNVQTSFFQSAWQSTRSDQDGEVRPPQIRAQLSPGFLRYLRQGNSLLPIPVSPALMSHKNDMTKKMRHKHEGAWKSRRVLSQYRAPGTAYPATWAPCSLSPRKCNFRAFAYVPFPLVAVTQQEIKLGDPRQGVKCWIVKCIKT